MINFTCHSSSAVPSSLMVEDSGAAMGEEAASDPVLEMASLVESVPGAADPVADSETSDRGSGSADR
jgi:hypothetical protein